MSVVWSPEALADVEAALEYIGKHNVRAAEKLAAGIVSTVERLEHGSLEGPEHILKDGERVRGWPYPPFRIYYQRRPTGLWVIRVYHGRREPITR